MEQQAAKMMIRHVTGSKKGQTETFNTTGNTDIRIGRDPNNQIAYDPVKEDTISREHCRIVQDINKPDVFYVIDSSSKNGTYINGNRIHEKTEIFSGDIIMLGKDGPSFEFDLDPRPAYHVKKTRMIDTPHVGATKMHDMVDKTDTALTTDAVAIAKESVGKQTMQHMLHQSEKKSKKGLLITALALVLLVGTGAFVLSRNQKVKEIVIDKTPAKTGLTPAEIAKANTDKVVYIEAGWKLTNASTGEEMYHVYYPVVQNGKIAGYKASYIMDDKGKIVPMLASKGDYLKTFSNMQGLELDLIGSRHSGTGFVVDPRGFIVTNRHVAASWLTSYPFQDYAFPGVLLKQTEKGLTPDWNTSVSREQVHGWVPGADPNYKGVNNYMTVTFANNAQRHNVTAVNNSQTHDVSMINISLVENLPKVELDDTYDKIQPGDPVVVMGYPAIAPTQLVLKQSRDFFNANPDISSVPVPTLSNGNIGRLVRGSEKNSKIDDYKSSFGDYYQLTINSTGGGNSGGPMFDEKGKVIGIYSAGSSDGRTSISFAVPIRYAMELLGRQQVIN